MAKKLYAFVRFFKTESHRDTFLRGDLYMNRLRFFKAYEEQDSCNIGDKHEGTSGWYQPDQIRLTIQDSATGESRLITDFAGPILVGLTRHNDYHVYCMSAIYVDDESRFETFEELKSSIMLDVETGDLGNYCSVIEARVFIERLDEVLNIEAQAGSVVGRGLVEYFDPETFSGSFDEDQAIMRKKRCFSHQKEYRIFVYNGTSNADSRTINIGDLSDVAFNCLKADLNKHVTIDLKS
ncbi:hypothetical protein [Pseudomonas sp. NFACC45]|uniref:hypothetical protein n=1 Tax=Pseudomonas sp. NFACC45 TaxID=1566201 RepID=UPI0008EF2691|nr:hypothetical protein [Pseudomonas sp. NFACC45]SFH12963.1 hypothetical protein SAMN03159297_03229 [Pseudomonas sp. NFACC45]